MAEEVAEYDPGGFAGISVVINSGRDVGRRNKTARVRFPKTRAARPKRCLLRFILQVTPAGFFWSLLLGHKVLGFLHDGFVWQFCILLAVRDFQDLWRWNVFAEPATLKAFKLVHSAIELFIQ